MHRAASGPAETKLTAANPWTSRRVQNHQLTLPVSASVAPRPPVHPSRAGGRGRHCGSRRRPSAPCHTPLSCCASVDIVFHRYTRQVILALPHHRGPGYAPGPKGGCTRMMRAYELMVIIDGDLEDTAAQAWVKSITDSHHQSRRHDPRQARLVGPPAVRLPDQQEGIRLLRRVPTGCSRRRPRRARALVPHRGRHRPPQAHPSSRYRGSAPRLVGASGLTGRPSTPRRTVMADNTVTIVGNLTRDPELRFTAGGKGVASFGMAVNRRYQVERRMAGEGVVLQRHRVGHARRERRRVAHQGHPRHRHRPPRAARVRDPGRREAQRRRDRRRRDRAEPALGPRPGRAHAAHRPRRRHRRQRPAAARTGGGGRASRSRLRRRRAVLTPVDDRFEKRPGPMTSKKNRARAPKDVNTKFKKKTSVLVTDKVEYVDYKDVNLLPVRQRPGQDPQPAGHRQRRAAAARHRQRDQERARDGAAALHQARVADAAPAARHVIVTKMAAVVAVATATAAAVATRPRPTRSCPTGAQVDAPTQTSTPTTRRWRPEHEDHSPLRPQGPRQARRHRRGVRRLRPQLPAAPGPRPRRPPTVRSTRPARCAAPATCATPRTARRAQTIASALVPKVITISAKSGAEGKLFGSVTVADVAHAVEEQTSIDLDRKKLHMRTDQDARHAHGDGQAAQRRRVPDHGRGRQQVSIDPRRIRGCSSTGLSTALRRPSRRAVSGCARHVRGGLSTRARHPTGCRIAKLTSCCPYAPQARSVQGR